RYRTPAEAELWRMRDPVDRFHRLLEREGHADDGFFDEVGATADEAAARLRAGTLGAPDPEPLSMFDHVYATDHPTIAEERSRYRDYLAGFENATHEEALS
ncbi:MAG: pyruvate dehydrogenase (acetyl-transferring) E1 component subunit alpha, partial [Rhodococcus sp. (in: high G+C Gram-positive bacteria)]|nr:pyruvate dehydrogenase (acetyl-transferring) E1 component subunit alpha [Rhodococcus sp. (in: high G+C Gram-positive bacteria)]MDX5452443.1 pyruvate dehydrogenase (acetyl-transferring) E1 component subunit alpha [Rhodococcus sp. (in: high G+C Gram-positive bacteria)]